MLCLHLEDDTLEELDAVVGELLGDLSGIGNRERRAQKLLELRGGFVFVPLAPRDRTGSALAPYTVFGEMDGSGTRERT